MVHTTNKAASKELQVAYYFIYKNQQAKGKQFTNKKLQKLFLSKYYSTPEL